MILWMPAAGVLPTRSHQAFSKAAISSLVGPRYCATTSSPWAMSLDSVPRTTALNNSALLG